MAVIQHVPVATVPATGRTQSLVPGTALIQRLRQNIRAHAEPGTALLVLPSVITTDAGKMAGLRGAGSLAERLLED